MVKTDVTTIQVSRDTREELKSLGIKGETYDDILRRLIKTAKRGSVKSVGPREGR